MIKDTNLKDKQSSLRPVSRGDVIEGKIIDFGRSTVFIDLGPQGTGIIYGREFYEVKSAFKDLKIGSQIIGEIISVENEDGYRELSIKRAIYQKIWDNLKELKEQGKSLDVKVLGANRGGLLTKISDIPAFIPASQLALDHFPRVENADKSKILSKLEELVNQVLKVKILDINPKEEKIILSEKLEELGKTKEALSQYKVGDVVEGKITGLADFGAFVAFGPHHLEGLIHVSELDWGLVKNPAEVVKVGEQVKVKIIDISHNRVSLSLKALKKPSSQEKPDLGTEDQKTLKTTSKNQKKSSPVAEAKKRSVTKEKKISITKAKKDSPLKAKKIIKKKKLTKKNAKNN